MFHFFQKIFGGKCEDSSIQSETANSAEQSNSALFSDKDSKVQGYMKKYGFMVVLFLFAGIPVSDIPKLYADDGYQLETEIDKSKFFNNIQEANEEIADADKKIAEADKKVQEANQKLRKLRAKWYKILKDKGYNDRSIYSWLDKNFPEPSDD